MNKTKTENRYVQILSTGVRLEGIVSIPEEARGFVVFVHGSESSRHSPRNQYVAQSLQEGGFATLLFDLLTAYEEESELQTRYLRFDISLLATRTAGVLEWLELQPFAYGLRKGLFASSTGAAAALMAAADLPDQVQAIVARGGRPDLAGAVLPSVQAPTLLIVGGSNEADIDLNEKALASMTAGAQNRMIVVPGASHRFEESGALEHAAGLARDWFQDHLDQVRVH